LALYNNWVITKKYASTEVAAISTQNKIEFVRFISSDDKFAQSDLESFDDLVLNTIKTKSKFPVSSVKISGSTVTVTGILNSTGNTVDYDMNTLLLVCKYNGTEFLAAATTAQTPFRLPAENTAEVTEYTIRPQLTLSNSDTVSTVVDPVSPATNERVDDEVKKLQDQINSANTDRKSIWDKIAGLVDKSTNQTIAGIKTFTSTIVGNISGNAESATKLKTAQKVTLTGDASGSATFNGTQAVSLPATLATISQGNTTSSISPNYNESFTTVDSVKTDTKGRVTGANTKTVKLPVAYVHPSVSQSDTTSVESPNNGSTFTAIDSVKRNGQGHVTGVNTKTVTMPTQTNVTGNAATATKLKTPRKINGTDFDGTQDINVKATNDSDIVHKSGSESISGTKAFTGGFSAKQIPSPTDSQTASSYGVRQVTSDGKDGQLQYIVRTNPQIVETANGFSIGISAGANSIYAGGEAHIALLKAIQTPETTPPVLSSVKATSESAIVVSDADTYIGTNYQNGATTPTTGYWWKFGKDGNMTAPGIIEASTFSGKLNGNATSATRATTTTGNAGSATKWQTARKVSIAGDLTGSTTIDGSKDVSISSKLNIAAVAKLMYPVGSYYMSSSNKNPKDIFGVGTWQQVKGKVLVGVDESDTTFAKAGLTGGEKTHKLTVAEMPSHTHIQNSHNHTQNSHSHPANNPTLMGQNGNTKYGEGGYKIMGTISAKSWTTGTTTATNNAATATNQNTGGDGAHNNLQPFKTAYIWLRTA
jgi:microcystin-dependent protein